VLSRCSWSVSVKRQKFDKKKTKLVTCKVKHRSYFIMKNIIENAGRKTLFAPNLFIYLTSGYLVTLTSFTVFRFSYSMSRDNEQARRDFSTLHLGHVIFGD
jgi:hypothetical protein